MFYNEMKMLVPALTILLVSTVCGHPGHEDFAVAPGDAGTTVSQSAAPASESPDLNSLQAVPAKPVEMPQLRLPVLGDQSKPWSGTNLNNDPKNFQFAIVSDNTGAMRPGVFQSAISKLNLLQPEFVMSVGDLIMGYSTDEKLVRQQWDDLEAQVAKLTMPFFYVPGNHDVSNATQKAEWSRRFGPNYYHFTYGNVLFLCLDTEDAGKGALSAKQIQYFKKALAENQDVRWTLVFMHRPVWVFDGMKSLSPTRENELKLLKESRWHDMEQLLEGRKHTVYAGHVHSYTKFVRNNSKYFVLATTGGGSALRGAEDYGQFDEVVWITMTDNGPIMANLLLDGILDEDVRTDDVALMVRTMLRSAVTARLTATDPVPFSTATMNMRLDNQSTVPLTLTLLPPKGAVRFKPTSATVTLPPKSRQNFKFQVDGSRASKDTPLEGLDMQWVGTAVIPGKPKLEITSTVPLVFDSARVAKRAVDGAAIDGNFAEWTTRWSRPQSFDAVIGSKRAWGGMDDASVEIASQWDDEFIYLAARIKDDSIVAPIDAEKIKTGDFTELFLSLGTPENLATTEGEPSTSVSNRLLRVVARPSDNSTSGVVYFRGDHQFNAVCVSTPDGYQMEMAVPVDLFNEAQGTAWTKFALNVKVNDCDTTGSKKAELWWKPEWNEKAASPDSGWFIRE